MTSLFESTLPPEEVMRMRGFTKGWSNGVKTYSGWHKPVSPGFGLSLHAEVDHDRRVMKLVGYRGLFSVSSDFFDLYHSAYVERFEAPMIKILRKLEELG